tara:strand:- start:96 stop:629 length:534 start_codon:yes stop_codon:yes gene_type:complete
MSPHLKVISLFIFTIFISSCSTGTKLVNSDKIKPGMTKLDVELVLSFRAINYQAAIPLGYREYFSNLKKEILADEKKQVYYVYRNVFTPVTCGFILCNLGDGILEKTFFDYSDARNFVKGKEDVKIKPKSTITIESNGQLDEVDSADIVKLQSLIKDFESEKITEEEFNKKKLEIIK